MNSTHLIYDFKHKPQEKDIETLMDSAISTIGDLTVVDKLKHNFNPQGLSLIYILAESHISIHTWDEYDYISVDMYTCGEVNPLPTLNEFLKHFDIIKQNKQVIVRGL